MTEILKINPQNIDLSKIKQAAGKIEQGGLVAFPTETVYGLGADSMNPQAVVKIFKAKNRPPDDPLIVHISEKKDLSKLVRDIPVIVSQLCDEFWPGPLTLILKKAKNIPDVVTAGLDTIAVRMPDNKIALDLIKQSHTPIAAPSANLFGRTSAVTAQHVWDDLANKVDLIIDGGKTEVGVESTILDLTQKHPFILRPGGISREDLEEVIEQIAVYPQDKILSPGMYPKHYSPRAKVILVEGNGQAQVEKIRDLVSCFNAKKRYLGILTKEENEDKYIGGNVKLLGPGDDLAACAANLFSVLREFDREGVDTIIVEGVKEEGMGAAIMDRLRKAAGG